MRQQFRITLFSLFIFACIAMSFSPQAKAVTVLPCDADVNLDGHINLFDWNAVVGSWGQNPPSNPRADINKNGKVDIIDVGDLFNNWGKTCTPSPTPSAGDVTGSPTGAASICNQSCSEDTDCVSLTTNSSLPYVCQHEGFTGAGYCRLAANPSDGTCSIINLTTTPGSSRVTDVPTTATPTPTPAFTTAAPTVTGSSKVTPTGSINLNVCGQSCTSDSDCVVNVQTFSTAGKSSYVCYRTGFTGAGECRLASNPTDFTCSAPTSTPTPFISPTSIPTVTPVPTITAIPTATLAARPTVTGTISLNLCHQACTSNADCITSVQTFSSSTSYICYNAGFTGAGECRLASNPSSSTCSAAVPTQTPAFTTNAPKSPTPTPTAVPVVASYSLIDADTDLTVVGTLSDGYTVRLSRTPKFSVRVNMRGNVGSVRIVVTGTLNQSKVENGWPYATGGNVLISSGVADYSPWVVGPGTYKITATGYSGPNATGTAFSSKTLTITVAQ